MCWNIFITSAITSTVPDGKLLTAIWCKQQCRQSTATPCQRCSDTFYAQILKYMKTTCRKILICGTISQVLCVVLQIVDLSTQKRSRKPLSAIRFIYRTQTRATDWARSEQVAYINMTAVASSAGILRDRALAVPLYIISQWFTQRLFIKRHVIWRFEFNIRSDLSGWRRLVTDSCLSYKASKGNGSFCAAFGCSNRKSIHKKRHFFSFSERKRKEV